MYANFGDPSSHDQELKTYKKLQFLAGKFINSLKLVKAKLKFEHNVVGAYKCFVQTESGGAWSYDPNVTGQKWQKVDEFDLIYLDNY